MSLSNAQIAAIFDACADMLEIKGESVHRYLAYRRAAEIVRELPRDLHAMAVDNQLTEIAGIGETLAAKISEMLTTGRLEFYERLKTEVPQGLLEIIRINGLGPKKAKLFWEQLQITTLAELEAAAKAGKLAELKGMGKKSEQKILEGIAALARQSGRAPLGEALPLAQAILEALTQRPDVIEGAIAGSIRRGRPTIGDVDLLVAVDDMQHSPAIMEAFVSTGQVARILGQGPTKSSIELTTGLQIDLRVLVKERWGTALSYFTGSVNHNVRLRQIALDNGYSLNEHAFSPVDSAGNIIEDAPKIYCGTEESVYEQLGLPWIAPELREDSGEIEAAREGRLPNLIKLADIRGDLHMHTTYSDGKYTIRQMAEAAYERGRQYIVITDHSRSLGIANGLSIERLMQQAEEVRAVDAEMSGKIRVFHGTEMDINADGSLDYPDEILEKLDFVIASLHVSLRQDREQITQRLLNAINNPHVDMIGHPRAQQIPGREPVDADMDAVFAAARQTDTALEINSNPYRLDLEAQYARRAAEMGILLAINTDAHRIADLDLLPYGIVTARRGWVEAHSVLNTRPVEQFIAWIQQRQR